MTRYSLDANVVPYWLLQAGIPGVDQFWAGLEQEDELIGAVLLRPERTSIIREYVYRRLIRPARGRQLVDELIRLLLRINDSANQFRLALDMAERLQTIKAYDMQYLAVAQIEGAKLVTADRGLCHARMEVGVPVRFVL